MNYDLLKMLTYKRPEGSLAQSLFCKKYIEPIFGESDKKGNYIHIIGDKPKVAFMAHHDTVHYNGGLQKLVLDKNLNTVHVEADCLGADCTTGVWLILKMIQADVPGVYVIHAAEEVGCIGSKYIVGQNPEWFDYVDFAISFDRRGYDSVVTHQLGERTCSDDFADSLIDIIGLEMKKDPTGSYTDSNEYVYDIAECTNISVGYFKQHSAKEYQDLDFANKLLDRLIVADWDSLVLGQEPREWSNTPIIQDDLMEMIVDYPEIVHALLTDMNISAEDLEFYSNTSLWH